MTLDQLMACTGSPYALAEIWLEPLTSSMETYAINTPKRQAAFLAQIGHESGGLNYTHELWGPTRSQEGYEGRADLGNTQPGDGHRFLGRGFIQLTGRANYTKASEALCLDCINQPEILEKSPWAAVVSCCWWSEHGLNALADKDAFMAITRRINGGMNGLDHRVELWNKAKQALGIS